MSGNPSGHFKFGIPLAPAISRQIKRRLEALADRAPAMANLSLRFEQRQSRVKGFLTIDNFEKSFRAVKASHDPLQTYLLLEEDIDRQLEQWKKARFKKNPVRLKPNQEKNWRFA